MLTNINATKFLLYSWNLYFFDKKEIHFISDLERLIYLHFILTDESSLVYNHIQNEYEKRDKFICLLAPF